MSQPASDARLPATFRITPRALIGIGGSEYALVSDETKVPPAAHVDSGKIEVSYLSRGPRGGWRLRGAWPELLDSGTFGEPGNGGDATFRFGGPPLFMAFSFYVGMGERSDTIGVIRLARDRPVAFADVLAGAISPLPGSPVLTFAGNTCPNYAVGARVQAPTTPGALFSVRYDGWTAPPGALTPRTPLHLVTDYVPAGHDLVERPRIPLPTCGR